ncbi:MAG TPA: flagellar motor protein [Dissulfurispiraceae bacterium]|nr:flagellar motor protein [Dissulfurispiraceae bacterium]
MRVDFAAVIGIMLGIGAIVGGNIIEGGNTSHLLQGAAALIVFGGTFGATLLSFSMKDMQHALDCLPLIFRAKQHDPIQIITQVVDMLMRARKMGLIALQPEIARIENPFLKKGLNLVIDGMNPAMIRDILYQEIDTYEASMKRASRVFESAGGYAPTIGILGAVLGLIAVMKNVTDPSKIGSGIAVAFVATVYGVGSANLLFIPIAKKIINQMHEEVFIRELIIEGVLGIESGVNPYFLKTRLNAFLAEHQAVK